eukprot:3891988-Pyramimonas_sp.AAC.1
MKYCTRSSASVSAGRLKLTVPPPLQARKYPNACGQGCREIRTTPGHDWFRGGPVSFLGGPEYMRCMVPFSLLGGPDCFLHGP